MGRDSERLRADTPSCTGISRTPSNLRYPTNHVQLVAHCRRLPHHVSPARPIARRSQLALELRSGRLRPAQPRLYRLPRHSPRRSHRPVAVAHRPTRAHRKSLFPHPPRQRSSCSSGEYRSLFRARTLMDPARLGGSRRHAALLTRLHSRTRIALHQRRSYHHFPNFRTRRRRYQPQLAAAISGWAVFSARRIGPRRRCRCNWRCHRSRLRLDKVQPTPRTCRLFRRRNDPPPLADLVRDQLVPVDRLDLRGASGQGHVCSSVQYRRPMPRTFRPSRRRGHLVRPRASGLVSHRNLRRGLPLRIFSARAARSGVHRGPHPYPRLLRLCGHPLHRPLSRIRGHPRSAAHSPASRAPTSACNHKCATSQHSTRVCHDRPGRTHPERHPEPAGRAVATASISVRDAFHR